MYQTFPHEIGHLLDESFFRLVNKDNGGLEEAAHLAGDLGSLDLILWTEQIYKISNIPIKHLPKVMKIHIGHLMQDRFNHLRHKVEEHVQTRLARVLSHDVCGCQVKQLILSIKNEKISTT